MQKNRFETHHLLMIGLVLLGSLGILWRVFDLPFSVVFLLAVMFVSLLLLLYSQSQLLQLELVKEPEENVNPRQELENLLEQMPVGIVFFNPQDAEVSWYNPYAALILTNDVGEFDKKRVFDLVKTRESGSLGQTFEVRDKKFSLSLDLQSGVLYFFEGLSLAQRSYDLTDFSPVIGTISVDNYDDVTASLTDAETSQINSFVANFISLFAQNRQLFYRRVDMDRYYFFTDYAVLSDLMTNKFAILDEFRKQASEKSLALTLSMGIAFGGNNHYELGHLAQKNLNMALVRGGDQVVVKENAEHKDFLYFGGGSAATVKRSRTRTRAMMTAISDKIRLSDMVFVVGHKNLDLDALGATVGMQYFAGQIIDQAYAVYDDDHMSPDIERAIAALKAEGQTPLISLSEARDMVTPKSLLVMVDHSKLALTLSQDFYDQFREVVIVDHHRRDEDYPQNAVLAFIESGASSASELVTELLQFQRAKDKLSRIQASILMAGIMLDTKDFSARVTSRTFDVASYLRTLGSDPIEIQKISATDFEEYRQINELILSAQKQFGNVLIAKASDQQVYSNVIASKAADTLLEMAGIEASFVIYKNDQNQVAISARSHSQLNVQKVMEKMGGGGHFNLAACQLTNSSLDQAYESLMLELSHEVEGNDTF